MPLTLAEAGEEKHHQKNRREAGGQGTPGEPRFCCGRDGHGCKRYRRQCDREREGLPCCGQQRDGTEDYGLSKAFRNPVAVKYTARGY